MPVIVFLDTLIMGYHYVWSAILIAHHVSINLQSAKVVIPHNTELLLATHVLAKMDIIKVFRKSVYNVSLAVKLVLILRLIANPVIN